MQDTLSNFASGMLILIYRPFDVGDFVEAGGVMGTVSHMSVVNTTFKTIDNQVLGSIVAEHDAVLDEPAPVIKLHELGDSGVMFVVCTW